MDSYKTYGDEQLIALLKGSDVAAFEEIYNRYWKKLLVRANLLLNSYADAEEIVQDIFIILWRKKDILEIRNGVHTYVAAMLQYQCFRKLAENKRKITQVRNSTLPEIGDDSTLQLLDYENLRSDLEKSVKQLPEKCQLIFRLSREQGLTDLQIADHLEISVNTVRTQMHRALTKLKTSLNSFFLL